MSEWPTVDELKRLLDVDTDEYDAHLVGLLDAAVDRVKRDIGYWDEATDVPTKALANAALRAAIVMRVNAETTEPTVTRFGGAVLAGDSIYQFWLGGHKRRFHIG